MENTVRCQSCGMPLDDGFFGTEKNGELNHEYCKFCYQDGTYLQPDLTVDIMIQMSINNMTEEQGFEDPQAEEIARAFIPTLKRWRKG